MNKKLILSILLILYFLSGIARENPFKRIQIKYTPEILQTISKLGLPIDFLKDDKWAILEIPDAALKKISDAGISYEVLIDDLENFYAERNRGNNPKTITEQFKDMKEYLVPAGFELGSMGGFCTYYEMLQHLDNMAANYPNLITQKQVIGTKLTVEGRPLFWIKISDNTETNETEPEVLYTGLSHAREPGSMQVLLFYMYYLLENYATNPEIKTLVDNTEMYFVPCVNPDGYIYNETTNPNGGGLWRKNRKNNGDGSFGVDLNRNFGYKWGYDNYGSSPSTSSLTYRGTAAFSEAETQIIRDFCNEHQFSVALNYHTYGNYLLYPWGYTASPFAPDYVYFNAIGKEMSTKNNFRVGTPVSILYLVNGESSDWMYGEQTTKPKIFSITSEIGNQTDGFWPAMTRIIPQCIESLNQNIIAAKLAGSYFLIKDANTFNLNQNSGYFSYKVERLGIENKPFTVSIQGLSNHFTNIGSAKTHGAIERLQKVTDSISFVLLPEIVPGEKIKFLLKIESGVFSKSDTITKTYGSAELLLSDNCSNMNNWESTKWNISTTSYVSPTSSITDSPSGNYANNETSVIILKNPANLDGAVSAWLTFYTKWALDGTNDYVTAEVSTNSGQVWTKLSGLYTSLPAVEGLPNYPIYMGKQTDWVKECIDLTAFCGSEILIKFTLKTDASTTKDGFYFDEFKIEKIDGSLHTQDYSFSSGWNGLSSFLIPANTSFDEIFAENTNQIKIVEDKNGNFYEPGNPASTLSNWNSQAGYLIKLNENSTFAIHGFPETYKHLNLMPGWNLIPVLTQSPVLISTMQVSPPGSVEVIKEVAGMAAWWPEMSVTSLKLMLPGKSYFIKMKNSATLTFP